MTLDFEIHRLLRVFVGLRRSVAGLEFLGGEQWVLR